MGYLYCLIRAAYELELGGWGVGQVYHVSKGGWLTVNYVVLLYCKGLLYRLLYSFTVKL